MEPESAERDGGEGHSGRWKMYLRFAAMIVTGMVVMYWVMFVGSWELSHVRWSQSRMFMALAMGGSMDWLIEDIQRNGPASTREEAEQRPVPDFDRPADRQCPTS